LVSLRNKKASNVCHRTETPRIRMQYASLNLEVKRSLGLRSGMRDGSDAEAVDSPERFFPLI